MAAPVAVAVPVAVAAPVAVAVPVAPVLPDAAAPVLPVAVAPVLPVAVAPVLPVAVAPDLEPLALEAVADPDFLSHATPPIPNAIATIATANKRMFFLRNDV